MASQLNIEKKLVEAKDKLSQLQIEEELVSEIEWCLGSYAFDKNPAGLYEKAESALKALTKFKKKNDKKVSKKLIDDLTKAIKAK
ncbi:MAG: hypothetical protein ACFHWX_05600 [Bacteroidota bacterium]